MSRQPVFHDLPDGGDMFGLLPAIPPEASQVIEHPRYAGQNGTRTHLRGNKPAESHPQQRAGQDGDGKMGQQGRLSVVFVGNH